MSRFAAGLVLALILVVCAPVAALAQPAGRPGAPAKADRDGDDLLDDLERRLDATPGDRAVAVIVTLRGEPTAARVRGLAGAVGGFRTGGRFGSIDAFAATVGERQARALARRGDVLQVEHDSRVRAFNGSAQASFGIAKARLDQPRLDGDADGDPAAYSARDLVAAVIDTGIDPTHRDLDEGKVIGFKDFVAGRATAYDDEGHGTHVAATLAGEGDARADGAHRGVAPAAALVGVKALDASGTGSMSTIAAAVNWVIHNRAAYGIEAVNLSLGSDGCGDGSDAASRAVDAAAAAGLVVTVAAGNAGPATCTVGAPAAARGALTVGAMADLELGGFWPASFSSRGPTLDGRNKPDVLAPGVRITSALAGSATGYAIQDGSSMAAPFLAGLALLMRDANPALTPAEVKQRVVATAVDWGRGGDNRTAASAGADIDYGAGRLDGYRALAAAGAPLRAPPVAANHILREGALAGTGSQKDFRVEVADTATPFAATLLTPAITGAAAATPNFDLLVVDPAGAVVARAATAGRQEQLAIRPARTGTFTVRVLSRAGGGSFFVDLSGALRFAVSASPSSAVVRSGTRRARSASRKSYLSIASTRRRTFRTRWDARFAKVPRTLSNLRVSYTVRHSRTCRQAIQVYRYKTWRWVTLARRNVGRRNRAFRNLRPRGAASNYVSRRGVVTVRATCATTRGRFGTYTGRVRIDYQRP